MAERNEIIAVYAAAVIQGVALVTFPAASTIFTSPDGYGLSSAEYGAIFVPQAITAIAASLLGAGLTASLGIKRIYLLGLAGNLLAMMLLVASQFVTNEHMLALTILLVATGSLGVGFGLTVPSLNTFAAAFFPRKQDKAVLVLNALLGLGTTLAPVFVALFVGLHIWWGLPILVSLLLAGLLLWSTRLPLRADTQGSPAQTMVGKAKFPSRFWIYAAFALVYGVCETMNGNWASLYITQSLGGSANFGAVALAVFWASVTIGRVFFAAVERWFSGPRIYRLLPFIVGAAFLNAAYLSKGASLGGIAAFGLAGLGCSALLPLTISLAQKELIPIAASVAGGVIAFYQIGYGIAAFGVGPLQTRLGLSLDAIYGAASLVALLMVGLSFAVVRRTPDTH